jgi:hypothetical protein
MLQGCPCHQDDTNDISQTAYTTVIQNFQTLFDAAKDRGLEAPEATADLEAIHKYARDRYALMNEVRAEAETPKDILFVRKDI